MRDFELQPTRHHARRQEADQAPAAASERARPATAAPSKALDAASMLRLQRTAGNAGVVQMLGADEEQRSPVHEVVGSGGGSPLDQQTRSSMESAFGQSFDDVRVHTDDRASQSAESVGANAYTVGSDIVFRSGHFDPGTPTGQRTIAHELTHVVQQRSGPVDGSEAAGGIRVSDPADRFERAADQTADQVMSSAQPASAAAPVAQLEEEGATGEPAVQRQEDEDEGEEVVQA